MAKRPRPDRKPGYQRPEIPQFQESPIPRTSIKASITPQTAAQADLISSIKSNHVTFACGPAGTGKTYIGARIASEMMLARHVSKIILTRPAVESGRSIGFLPGELEEKMAPYVASFGPGFRDGLGEGHFEYMQAKGKIQVVPLNFMQGLSWDGATICLFDEAENATAQEFKMILTRLGEGAKIVISGDPEQSMINDGGYGGMRDAIDRLRGDREVGIIEFTRNDIVRSGLTRRVLDAYDDIRTGLENFTLPSFITA